MVAKCRITVAANIDPSYSPGIHFTAGIDSGPSERKVNGAEIGEGQKSAGTGAEWGAFVAKCGAVRAEQ